MLRSSPMQQVPPDTSKDGQEIAENIRSGEFFRESLQDYHARYDDLISERYYYLAVTLISIALFCMSLIGIGMIYPLSTKVPFIYYTADIVEDLPIMKRLGKQDADPNILLKNFLLSNYVRLREQYSIDTVDRNANGIKSQSSDEVYDDYQSIMNPSNPESPIALFQRQAIRRVDITSIQPEQGNGDETVYVNFTATIFTSNKAKKVLMRAIISFRFEDIGVDHNTGKTIPHGFIVTKYKSESLGL